jgi:hypothetical protein
VCSLKFHVTKKANVLDAIHQLEAETRKATGAHALSAKVRPDIYTLQIRNRVGLGNDVRFENKLVTVEDHEHTTLLDPSHYALQEAFTILDQRIYTTFDLGYFSVSFRDGHEFFRSCDTYIVSGRANWKRKTYFEQ